MADNRSRYVRSRHSDEDGVAEDDDPLVELARIVSEDGGFYRSRPVRDAQRAPQRRAEGKAFSPDLEAELYQEFELSVTPPTRDQRRRATEPAVQKSKGVGRNGENKVGRQSPVVARPIPAVVARPVTAAPVVVAAQPDRASRRVEHAAPQVAATGGRSVQLLPPHVDETEWEDDRTETVTARASASKDHVHREYASERLDDFDLEDGFECEADNRSDRAIDGNGVASYEPGETDDPNARSSAPARRPRKSVYALAGVFGLVIAGGAVAAMMATSPKSGTEGPALVIKAELGAVKVVPTSAETGKDEAGDAVFDSATGKVGKSEEKLIDRAEEPKSVTRVILPGTTEDTPEAQALDEAKPSADLDRSAVEAASGSTEQPVLSPIGPRKVRTLVIKPDGSTAQSQEAAPSETLAGLDPFVNTPTVNATDSSVASEGEARSADAGDPARNATSGEEAEVAASAPASSDPAEAIGEMAAAPTDGQNAPQAEASAGTELALAPTDTPPAGAEAAEAAGLGAPYDGVVPSVPLVRPTSVPEAASPAKARTATRSKEPVDLLAAAPAEPKTSAAPETGSSGYVVQVASQRSQAEAKAAFERLQRQHPTLLGSRQADIQRADLGKKGTFYRARVGQMESRADAIRLCEQLKAAGASCFVSR